MTPEQKKQAEISQSLAKQHEVWRAASPIVPKEVPVVGTPRPLATVAASPLMVSSPEGSPSTQVVVS